MEEKELMKPSPDGFWKWVATAGWDNLTVNIRSRSTSSSKLERRPPRVMLPPPPSPRLSKFAEFGNKYSLPNGQQLFWYKRQMLRTAKRNGLFFHWRTHTWTVRDRISIKMSGLWLRRSSCLILSQKRFWLFRIHVVNGPRDWYKSNKNTLRQLRTSSHKTFESRM